MIDEIFQKAATARPQLDQFERRVQNDCAVNGSENSRKGLVMTQGCPRYLGVRGRDPVSDLTKKTYSQLSIVAEITNRDTNTEPSKFGGKSGYRSGRSLTYHQSHDEHVVELPARRSIRDGSATTQSRVHDGVY